METKTIEEKAVREYLCKNKTFSVPMLQTEFNLSYIFAKKMADMIIMHNWAYKKAEGVYFRILHDNILGVTLSEKKVKELYEKISTDCYSVISYLSDNGYADRSELLTIVQGRRDTDNAIKKLLEEGVIYELNGYYYLRLSKQSIEKLYEIKREALARMEKMRSEKADSRMDREHRFFNLFGDADTDSDDDSDD